VLVLAAWSLRENPKPSQQEEQALYYLLNDWCHPSFIPITAFERMLRENDTKNLAKVITTNWSKETLPSWYHNIWVGLINPSRWLTKVNSPWLLWSIIRDTVTLHRMHNAFTNGLLYYGILSAIKK